MNVIAALIGFLLLSGCAGSPVADAIAGPEKLAQQDDAYCKSIGLNFGTSQYADCRMVQSQGTGFSWRHDTKTGPSLANGQLQLNHWPRINVDQN